jgi:hypothetical protein
LRVALIAAGVLTLLFVGSLAAAGAGLSVPGIKVTPLAGESDSPIPDDLSDTDPSAPVVPSDSELSELESKVDYGPEGQALRTFSMTVTRTYAGETVTVKGTRLNYGEASSYGFQRGTLLIETSSSFPVDVAPATAPSGFVSRTFWALLVDDAQWEVKYAYWGALQQVIREITLEKMCQEVGRCVWSNFLDRNYGHDEYLAWVHEQYAKWNPDEYTGISYSEASVKASCGGVYFAWRAPWGCATLRSSYVTEGWLGQIVGGGGGEAAGGRNVQAGGFSGDRLFHVATHPLGIISTDDRVAANIAVAGEMEWCENNGEIKKCELGDSRAIMFAYDKNGVDTYTHHLRPLLGDFMYDCSYATALFSVGGIGEGGGSAGGGQWNPPVGLVRTAWTHWSDWKDGCPTDPASSVSGNFLYSEGPASALYLGLMSPFLGIDTERHAVNMNVAEKEEIINYLNGLKLIDKLIFMGFVMSRQTDRHLTSNLLINAYNTYLQSNDPLDLRFSDANCGGSANEPLSRCNSITWYAFASLHQSKMKADLVRAGRWSFNAQLYSDWLPAGPGIMSPTFVSWCTVVTDENGVVWATDCTKQDPNAESLLSLMSLLCPDCQVRTHYQFALVPNAVLTIPNTVIVDIADLWFIIPAFAGVLLIVDFTLSRRHRLRRRKLGIA